MDSAKSLQQFTSYMYGRVSESTLRVYVQALKHWFASVNSTDSGIPTPELAQAYIDSLAKSGKSPSTIGLKAHAIMNFFRSTKRDVHLVCPPIKVKRPEYLKPQEVERVIKACRTQLERTVVVMLYDTAVRISELLNLTTDNVDWENKTICVVGKGGGEAEVNISDKALKELRSWLNARQGASKKVFLDLGYYTVWGIVKNVGKRAGLSNIHPHIFRHSRAIQLLKARVPINIVSQHLRHKSIATTIDVYGNFTTPDIREQIAPW